MADALQPNLPTRAPTMDAAVNNRTGIVMPPDAEEAESALDKAFEQELGRKPTSDDNTAVRDRAQATDPEVKTASEMPDEVVEVVEETAPTIAKTETTAPAVEEAAPETPKPVEDPLESLLGEKAPAVETPAAAPAEDPYEAHKLHQNASEKTRNTFDELKRVAREREQRVKEEAEKTKAELKKLREEMEQLKANPVAKEVVPENIQKELKELREFRATFDTERDPEFRQQFDARREQNNAAIFDTLKRNGLKDEVIAQLQTLPYDQQVEQISRWAEKLSPRDKIAIQAKLVANESVEADRAKALQEAKAKADQILAQKASAPQRNEEQFVQEVITTLKPIIPRVSILQPKEVSESMSAKEKAEVAAHNEAVAKNSQLLLGFLKDDSAKTRSTLALAGILAPHYRQQMTVLEARVAQLTKELDGIKNAGRLSRTRESGGTAAAAAPKIDIFETNADDAMEQAWKNMNGGV